MEVYENVKKKKKRFNNEFPVYYGNTIYQTVYLIAKSIVFFFFYIQKVCFPIWLKTYYIICAHSAYSLFMFHTRSNVTSSWLWTDNVGEMIFSITITSAFDIERSIYLLNMTYCVVFFFVIAIVVCLIFILYLIQYLLYELL